jgi:protein-S-isoprenylcysteine O-methyltransferase Ste14
MRRPAAALGSSLFFLMAPSVVAGLIPWWLTGWRVEQSAPYWPPFRVIGVALITVGIPVLVHSFVRFVMQGGTPAPIAPTERLVVSGLYRYVRNPMYLAVLSIILGQALLFGQLRLLWYAGLILLAFVTFVRTYEEPTLARQFGDDYDEYRRGVPAWWPRLHPWNQKHQSPPSSSDEGIGARSHSRSGG